MNHAATIERVKAALAEPLQPGLALELMAPRMPSGLPLHGSRPFPADARPAAGLVLLYPGPARKTMFVLTERSPHLPAHPGQIGLPAGMQSLNETLERTARREAEEEIGIDAGALTMLGALSPVYIPPSHIVLHPFVGHLPEAPILRALPREVTRIFEIPLAALIDPASLHAETRQIQEWEAVVPYFALAGEKIWGATAIVLAELRYLMGGSRAADQAARKRAT